MNILISALSLYTPGKNEEYVLCKDNTEYRVFGKQTNEPVAKALQLYLQKKGQALDKIILLCTPATLSPDENGENSVDKFRNAITADGICPEIDTICLKELADSQAIYNTSMELIELCRMASEPELYIDSTGGFRDAMMFLISMMQLLKEENIRIADIFYTIYDRNTATPHPIVSRMDAYLVYDLISGYEALETYGDPQRLKEYFTTRTINKTAKSILDTLQNVYMEMKICRVAQSTSALLRLSKLLDEYTYGDDAFDRVVELAKNKYGGIRDGFTYLDYIKWYHSHGYIPQTLAFFYEMLPELLVENRILYYSDELLPLLQKSQTTQTTIRTERYYFINTYFKDTQQESKVKIANAKKELQALADNAIDESELSKPAKKLYDSVCYIMLGKRDPRFLKKPEVIKLFDIMKEDLKGTKEELNSVKDLLKFKSTKSLLNKISTSNNFICSIYNIDPPNKELPPEAHAQLIINSIDNKTVLLGENTDKNILTNLLEKYFYLKNQRNSVLHVGVDSSSYKTLLKNIEDAIELLNKILS